MEKYQKFRRVWKGGRKDDEKLRGEEEEEEVRKGGESPHVPDSASEHSLYRFLREKEKSDVRTQAPMLIYFLV